MAIYLSIIFIVALMFPSLSFSSSTSLEGIVNYDFSDPNDGLNDGKGWEKFERPIDSCDNVPTSGCTTNDVPGEISIKDGKAIIISGTNGEGGYCGEAGLKQRVYVPKNAKYLVTYVEVVEKEYGGYTGIKINDEWVLKFHTPGVKGHKKSGEYSVDVSKYAGKEVDLKIVIEDLSKQYCNMHDHYVEIKVDYVKFAYAEPPEETSGPGEPSKSGDTSNNGLEGKEIIVEFERVHERKTVTLNGVSFTIEFLGKDCLWRCTSWWNRNRKYRFKFDKFSDVAILDKGGHAVAEGYNFDLKVTLLDAKCYNKNDQSAKIKLEVVEKEVKPPEIRKRNPEECVYSAKWNSDRKLREDCINTVCDYVETWTDSCGTKWDVLRCPTRTSSLPKHWVMVMMDGEEDVAYLQPHISWVWYKGKYRPLYDYWWYIAGTSIDEMKNEFEIRYGCNNRVEIMDVEPKEIRVRWDELWREFDIRVKLKNTGSVNTEYTLRLNGVTCDTINYPRFLKVNEMKEVVCRDSLPAIYEDNEIEVSVEAGRKYVSKAKIKVNITDYPRKRCWRASDCGKSGWYPTDVYRTVRKGNVMKKQRLEVYKKYRCVGEYVHYHGGRCMVVYRKRWVDVGSEPAKSECEKTVKIRMFERKKIELEGKSVEIQLMSIFKQVDTEKIDWAEEGLLTDIFVFDEKSTHTHTVREGNVFREGDWEFKVLSLEPKEDYYVEYYDSGNGVCSKGGEGEICKIDYLDGYVEIKVKRLGCGSGSEGSERKSGGEERKENEKGDQNKQSMRCSKDKDCPPSKWYSTSNTRVRTDGNCKITERKMEYRKYECKGKIWKIKKGKCHYEITNTKWVVEKRECENGPEKSEENKNQETQKGVDTNEGGNLKTLTISCNQDKKMEFGGKEIMLSLVAVAEYKNTEKHRWEDEGLREGLFAKMGVRVNDQKSALELSEGESAEVGGIKIKVLSIQPDRQYDSMIMLYDVDGACSFSGTEICNIIYTKCSVTLLLESSAASEKDSKSDNTGGESEKESSEGGAEEKKEIKEFISCKQEYGNEYWCGSVEIWEYECDGRGNYVKLDKPCKDSRGHEYYYCVTCAEEEKGEVEEPEIPMPPEITPEIPTPEEVVVQLPIKQGWNLISSPVELEVKDFENAGCDLKSRDGCYFWTWDSRRQAFICNKKIQPNRGYYVYSSKDCVVGSPKDFEIERVGLVNGWNLIPGTGQSVEVIMEKCNIPKNFVYYWQPEDGKWVNPDTLEKGKAYWVFLPGNGCSVDVS